MKVFQSTTLGRTGLEVCPLGLASSYGVGGVDVERAYEYGVNFFYWGALRTPSFGEGFASLAAAHRSQLRLVIQTFTREPTRVRESLESALRKLPRAGYADVFTLGAWDEIPTPAIFDAAQECVAAGLARTLMLSSHNRAILPQLAATSAVDALMVRYNAAHSEADDDVFPNLGSRRPGVVGFTATHWGDLINPKYTPAGEKTPDAADCYRYAMTNPSIDVCVTGPKDAGQLDQALQALDRGPMSHDELAWMRRVGAHVSVVGRQQAPAPDVLARGAV